MARTILLITLAFSSCAISGCALCCTPFDYAYAAHGGRWQRGDMNHGRVGSAFSPAGSMVAGPPVEVIPEGPVLAPPNAP